jgi:LPS export ABC transporter protein LptC
MKVPCRSRPAGPGNLAAALLACALAACAGREPPLAAPPAAIPLDGAEIAGLVLFASDERGEVYRLSAARARIEAGGERARLDGPALRVRGGGAAGGLGLRVSSARAAMDRGGSAVRLEGGVRIEGADGLVVETPRARCDLERRRLETEMPVVARGSTFVLVAGSLVADLASNKLYFGGGIQARFLAPALAERLSGPSGP